MGEWVCDEIYNYTADPFISEHIKEQCEILDEDMVKQSCLSLDELYHYESHSETHSWGLLGWHISDLVIYEKPKELSEFYRHDTSYDNSFGGYFEDRDKRTPIKRPPQSWCYVESA